MLGDPMMRTMRTMRTLLTACLRRVADRGLRGPSSIYKDSCRTRQLPDWRLRRRGKKPVRTTCILSGSGSDIILYDEGHKDEIANGGIGGTCGL